MQESISCKWVNFLNVFESQQTYIARYLRHSKQNKIQFSDYKLYSNYILTILF